MSVQAQSNEESPRNNASLCSEQFEDANDEPSWLVKSYLHTADNTASQSIQWSPTNDPVELNSISPLADTIGELIQFDAPSTVTSNGSTLTKDETPILNGTLSIPSRRSEGTTAASTQSPGVSLEHLPDVQNKTIAFQQCKPKFLADSIVSPKEEEYFKRQVDVLKKKFQAVTEEVETQIDSQAQPPSAEKWEMAEQIKELKLQLQSQISANVDVEEKFRAVHKEKEELLANRAESASISGMGQQLYHLGMQVGKRDAELADLRAKLVATHRRIADLSAAPVEQPEPTPSLSIKNQEIESLTRQLDETCAKYLEETERREIAEEQLRCLKAEQIGDQSSFNMAQVKEQGLVKELRNNVEQLEGELARLRQHFEEVNEKMTRAVQDADDQKEIVQILREDHAEGIRLIAERDQKITTLEAILHGLERSQVENIQAYRSRFND